MNIKYNCYLAIFSLVLIVHFLSSPRFVRGEAPLRVVTTLASYADITKSIGGDLVEVSSVASPRFNPHFIEPRPSDVLRVKRADLFIHSGLDLEAWRDPLLDAAARADVRTGGERQLDLSKGISLLEIPTHSVSRAEGDIHLFGNPHYWVDPRNGVIIAKAISEKLSEIDPQHSREYRSGYDTFSEKLIKKIDEWRKLLAPFHGEEVIGYHNEWIYFTNFAGLTIEKYLEPKPGIPPSPQHIEMLTAYIKEHHIHSIIQASYFPLDASETLAKRTQAKVVLLNQQVGETAAANNYIDMIDDNVRKIVEGMRHE